MTKINVIRQWDDHEPVTLCVVEALGDNDDARMRQLWDDFQSHNPDCDTDFIKYLQRHSPYLIVEDDNMVDVVLG